jgi:hypothetical protein
LHIWGSGGRAEDTSSASQRGSNWEIMTYVEDTTRQFYALCTVIVLQGADLRADLVEADVVADTSIWLRKAVHGMQLYLLQSWRVIERSKQVYGSLCYKIKIIGFQYGKS